MSNLPLANEKNFQEVVLESQTPVLVDFFAEWCGPCKAMTPVLEALAEEGDLQIIKVDVEQSPGLARQYGVRGIPTLTVFNRGEPVASHVGAANRSVLQKLVQQSTSQNSQ
ncbi:MAG: thioredoxin [Lysobacterales bacterium]